MTARVREPSLRLKLGRTRDGERHLRVSGRSGWRPEKFALADQATIRQQNAWLGGKLAQFRASFDGCVDVDPGYAARVLDDLVQAGRMYLGGVFASLDSVHRLSELFREACPGWDDETGVPPLVLVECQLQEHIPWEVLPVFAIRHRPKATNKRELAQACRPLLGFGALVERHVPHPVRASLPPAGPVHVRVFRHAGYRGAGEELGALYAKAPHVKVIGPYPPSDGAGGASVAQQLRNPAIELDGTALPYPDRVVHFACHCEAPSGKPWQDFTFTLSAQGQEPEILSVSGLLGDMLDVDPGKHRPRKHLMPLVFLNACGTAIGDPQSAASLLTPFERNGNRGMIGTAANVPDGFAARFSHNVYTSFFEGKAIGRALHEARWRMVLDAANPLGLLYTHYGDGSLFISSRLG